MGLLCRLGSGLCALPLDCVVETMRPLPIERLSRAPDFVLGVAVVRGQPVPVIDGARLVGAAETAAPGRLVTLRVGQRRAALAVTGVVGVRDLGGLPLGALPPLLEGAAGDVVTAIGALDDQLLLVLGAARAVPAAVWDALPAPGATK
ncbi:MAG TPA: chemotaxis protein CheW [Polyangia bacterium]|nr:chemotaxis protein CheW [Polyangia bacterium]